MSSAVARSARAGSRGASRTSKPRGERCTSSPRCSASALSSRAAPCASYSPSRTEYGWRACRAAPTSPNCRSRSRRTTLRPGATAAAARFVARKVLPHPPLAEQTVTTVPGSGRVWPTTSCAGSAAGSSSAREAPAGRRAGASAAAPRPARPGTTPSRRGRAGRRRRERAMLLGGRWATTAAPGCSVLHLRARRSPAAVSSLRPSTRRSARTPPRSKSLCRLTSTMAGAGSSPRRSVRTASLSSPVRSTTAMVAVTCSRPRRPGGSPRAWCASRRSRRRTTAPGRASRELRR